MATESKASAARSPSKHPRTGSVDIAALLNRAADHSKVDLNDGPCGETNG